MPWYYAENGQQLGPVPDEQFQSLVALGTVRADTLVWRDGMGNWAPYSAVAAPGGVPAAGVPPIVAPAGSVVCAECRQTFPVEQTVRFGDAFVCSNCKPVYVQKLREGAVTPEAAMGTLRYGGFWIRFVAKFIDGLIVGVPIMILFAIMGATGAIAVAPGARGGAPNPSAMFAAMGMQLMLQGIAVVIGAAYNIYFVSTRAATPGKMVVGLKIVNADGTKVSTGKAVGRYFAEMVSGLTCYIGYIIAGFDDQKRSLHDHICSTRVVYK